LPGCEICSSSALRSILQTGSTYRLLGSPAIISKTSFSSLTFLKLYFPKELNEQAFLSANALRKSSEHRKMPGFAWDAILEVRLMAEPKKLSFLFNILS